LLSTYLEVAVYAMYIEVNEDRDRRY